ncbi:hypothetical protein UlMin_006570 [Ulmus minor]
MTSLNSISQATLLVLGIALIVKVKSDEAQVCTTQQNNLNPSIECHSTLGYVDHDFFCNTLRFASRLPSLCNIPPLSFVVLLLDPIMV